MDIINGSIPTQVANITDIISSAIPSITSSNIPQPSTTEKNNESSQTNQTNGSPSSTVTSKSFVTSTEEITTTSAIPIVTVTSSGSIIYTFTTTSYSTYATVVPTMIEKDVKEQGNKSQAGAIAGGVVGGIAIAAIIGAIAFCLLRKKKRREVIGSSNELRETFTSRPFVPAYDPSKDYPQESIMTYPSDTVYDPPHQPMIRHVPDTKDYERHVPDEKH